MKKKKARRKAGGAVFVLVLCLLVGTVLLRYRAESKNSRTDTGGEINSVTEGSRPTMSPAEEDAERKTETAHEQSSGAENIGQNPGQSPAAAAEAVQAQEDQASSDDALPTGTVPVEAEKQTEAIVYNEQTYQLVTDIVYTMRNRGDEAEEDIRGLLRELKSADARLGSLWEGITDYWLYICRDFAVNRGLLPDGLPQDDSLGIAVLGFQLLYDGQMAPELIGRCETALSCAQQYPNARILVTGGGTAYGNPEATEAGVMALWFRDHGIPESRIIVEDSSLTTDQNAVNSCAILAEEYPQIQTLAIVSSDYHVALGSMLFTEAALLYAAENSVEVPYQVLANAAFATSGNPEYSDPQRFTADMWVMANPSY